MNKKWTTLLVGGALVITLAGVAFAAGTQGSQDNPLVTLSYLNQVVIPDLMKQVEEKIAARGETTPPGSEASFQTVELEEGDKLELRSGAQVLLRSGKAVCRELLTDVTDGEPLVGTGELKANHLYMASADGQTVEAREASTVMVLGLYEVK